MDIEKIFKELRFLPVVEASIRSEIAKDSIRGIAKTAYEGEDFHFRLLEQKPGVRLAVIVYLLQSKYEEYKRMRVPELVIWDTFRDVSLRAGLYYEKYGEAGIEEDDVIWFRHIMNVQIFQIGVLQYQAFEMMYPEEGGLCMKFSEEQKRLLPEHSPVINCHIQKGADLSYEAVGDSLKAATEFFGNIFPEIQYRAFVCYSWLLYPPMTAVLPEMSRIRRFAGRFQIIGSCGWQEQAMENLCGSRETALTKIAEENKEIFGFACGIISFREI